MDSERCAHCGQPASAEEAERLRAAAREYGERLRAQWLEVTEERIARYRAQLEAPRGGGDRPPGPSRKRPDRVPPPALEWRCAGCGRTSPSRQARRIAEEAPDLVRQELNARLTAAEEEFRAVAAGRQQAREAVGGPEQDGRRRSRWWRRG